MNTVLPPRRSCGGIYRRCARLDRPAPELPDTPIVQGRWLPRRRTIRLWPRTVPGGVRGYAGDREVVAASPSKAYLCLKPDLDCTLLSDLLLDVRPARDGGGSDGPALPKELRGTLCT